MKISFTTLGCPDWSLDDIYAKGGDYDGWMMFEHEKRWHPELEDPAEIFPVFAAWARQVIA
tara:strand:- start:587 stop:769 length:183 start_codon:yes stop_codon:yes gene_type:complete